MQKLTHFTWLLLGLMLAALPAQADRVELIVADGHQGTVNAVRFLSGGDRLLSGGDDGGAKLWDVDQRRVLLSFLDAEALKEGAYIPRVQSIAANEDKGLVATASHDGKIRIYDLGTGEFVRRFAAVEEADNPGDLRMDWAGDRLVSHAYHKELCFWSADGKKVAGLTLDFTPRDLRASHNGEWVAVAGDKMVVLVEVAQAKIVKKFDVYTRGDVAFSQDDKQLAISSDLVTVIDLATGNKIREVKPTTYSVEVSFLKSGQVVAGCQNTDFPHTGILNDQGTVSKPMFSEESQTKTLDTEGDTVAAGGPNGVIFVWRHNKELLLDHRSTLITAAASDRAGHYMVTGSRQGNVKIWDLATGRPGRILEGLRAYVGEVAISDDGTMVAASDLFYGEMVVWERASGKVLFNYKLENHRASFGNGITCMRFSPDGGTLAVVRNGDPAIYLFEPESGRRKLRYELEHSGYALAFSPDGRTLASGDALGNVIEWDTTRPLPIYKRQIGRHSRVYTLDYSPDGKLLVAGGNRGVLKIWEAAYDEPPKEYIAHNRTDVFATAFSKDHTLLTGGGDGKVMLWNLADGSRKELVGHSESVGDLVLLADDKVILSRGADRKMVLWTRASGEQIATLMELDHGQDWVVTTPNGRFDASGQGHRILDVRIDDRVYELDQFFNTYYSPGLLPKLVPLAGGARMAAAPSLAKAVDEKQPPRVKIVSPRAGSVSETQQVTVKVRVEDQGGGIADVALFHNGHRIPTTRARAVASSLYEFDVKLLAGKNEFKALAYNGDRSMESRRDRIRIQCRAEVARQPQLHVLTVGVDKYASGLSLNYAKADATAIAGAFSHGAFEEVKTETLINEYASKAGILGALKKLEESTEPQDGLVIYLAGHGTVQGDLYYFLPYDAKIATEEEVAASGISSIELADALAHIPATKQLVVLDTCRSGAAAGVLGKYLATRGGLEEIRSQQLLARTAGTFLIAASTSEQYAYELPDLGHGVLTYSLLKALKPAQAGTVTVNEVLRQVSVEVPQLTQKYHGSRQEIVQYSSGQDFPLSLVK